MQAKFKTFEELTSTAADFLKNKLFRSDGTVRHYLILWGRVKKYMGSQKIKHFDAAVGKQFLLEAFGDRDYCLLSKREKDLVKAVSILCEFYNTGSIQPVKEQLVFDGSIGTLMVKYLSYRTSCRLKTYSGRGSAPSLSFFVLLEYY